MRDCFLSCWIYPPVMLNSFQHLLLAPHPLPVMLDLPSCHAELVSASHLCLPPNSSILSTRFYQSTSVPENNLAHLYRTFQGCGLFSGKDLIQRPPAKISQLFFVKCIILFNRFIVFSEKRLKNFSDALIFQYIIHRTNLNSVTTSV